MKAEESSFDTQKQALVPKWKAQLVTFSFAIFFPSLCRECNCQYSLQHLGYKQLNVNKRVILYRVQNSVRGQSMSSRWTAGSFMKNVWTYNEGFIHYNRMSVLVLLCCSLPMYNLLKFWITVCCSWCKESQCEVDPLDTWCSSYWYSIQKHALQFLYGCIV